jgi:hypothetical protein
MQPVDNTRGCHRDLLTYRHIDVGRSIISSPQSCVKIISVVRVRAIRQR